MFIILLHIGNMGLFKMKKVNFDIELLVEIHRQTAISLYGNMLDKNKNVIGTDLYFDEFWRLRKRN